MTNRPSNSQVASAYDTICPNAACSMIVFETSGGEHRINEYNLQISSASCNNSLYSSNTFTELLETYGKSLAFRERYYECYFFLLDNPASQNIMGCSLHGGKIYSFEQNYKTNLYVRGGGFVFETGALCGTWQMYD